jgi:hypothetical protein
MSNRLGIGETLVREETAKRKKITRDQTLAKGAMM